MTITGDGNDTVSFTTNDLDLQNGNLDATGGSINVNQQLTTSGLAMLTALTGTIADGNGASVNISALSLDATAATGIDLDTTVTSLAAAITGRKCLFRHTRRESRAVEVLEEDHGLELLIVRNPVLVAVVRQDDSAEERGGDQEQALIRPWVRSSRT